MLAELCKKGISPLARRDLKYTWRPKCLPAAAAKQLAHHADETGADAEHGQRDQSGDQQAECADDQDRSRACGWVVEALDAGFRHMRLRMQKATSRAASGFGLTLSVE